MNLIIRNSITLQVTVVVCCCYLFFYGDVFASSDLRNTIHSDSTGYETKLKEGIDAFYSTDWNKARNIFNQLTETHPDDARAYFFRSMLPFWKYYFVEKSPEASEKFLRYSEKAIEISNLQLKRNPRDTTMVLMLSGLYGYRSLVAASEKEYRVAVQSGMEGFQYTRQLLALDSDDPKALIGKGMFYYMFVTIPSGLKWVTNLVGFSGDIEEGFKALKKAANSESYVRIDAKMILAYLYEREKMFDKAQALLQELSESHPRNIIFRYQLARMQERNGEISKAKASYNSVVAMGNEELKLIESKSKERLNNL